MVSRKRQFFGSPYSFTDNDPTNSGKDMSTTRDLYTQFSSVPLADEVETVNRQELEMGVQVCQWMAL